MKWDKRFEYQLIDFIVRQRDGSGLVPLSRPIAWDSGTKGKNVGQSLGQKMGQSSLREVRNVGSERQ
jgi:hypothetical protein